MGGLEEVGSFAPVRNSRAQKADAAFTLLCDWWSKT